MANSHIKGITVEIGGNTTELTKALRDVDKESKKSADELRSINALLKMDPSNITALSQKQEVLASSIDSTKQRIVLLKKAEQEAQKQFEKGEISAEQYRALQREVVYAEGKLKKLEKQLDDTKEAAKNAGKAIEQAGDDSKAAAKKSGELEKKLDDLKGKYDSAKDAAKDAGKELGATFAVGTAAIGASVASAMSYADALDLIRIQTGADEMQMKSLELAAKAVFDRGLGEDLDDIASTMAIISQQSEETDPDKLAQLAENALILRDSFGFETAEQMRAVQMLVDTFGITAEQAYDLIVQGAQKGLNKNGDLLDVINEYAVHYKQSGYGAEQFFNSLMNGAESGVFSIDKLGDATKEFFIRTKDEATSTTEAYEKLGLNADAMRQMFAAGGESAAEAAKIVNDALFSMDDEVAQNTVGVALYGTMWEDLGKDAIQSLSSVNGEISLTADAMAQVRDIKMDSTSTKWAQLGRTIQTELILPIGEKLLPLAEKLFSFCIEHSETLIPIIKTLATVIGTVFVVNKVAKFTKSIKELGATFKALKTASGEGFGVAGIAAAAFALTIRSIVAAQEKASKAYREARERLQELAMQYSDAADAAEEMTERQQNAANNVEYDYQPYEDLLAELDKLVDANGKIIEGNEDRVDYIKNELSAASGVEIEIIDGVVQKYDELEQSIQDALTARKTYDLLNSLESDYNDAKTALGGSVDEVGSQAAYEAAANRYYALLAIENDPSLTTKKAVDEAMKAYGMDWNTWTQNGGRETAYFAMQEALKAYEYNKSTVDRYESLNEAYYSQNAAQMREATDAIANPTYSAGEYSYATLRDIQIEAYENFKNLSEWSKREGSTVTQEQVDAAAAALQYATEQALLQWEAEGRPVYSTEADTDPTDLNGDITIRDMGKGAVAAFDLLGLDTYEMFQNLVPGYLQWLHEADPTYAQSLGGEEASAPDETTDYQRTGGGKSAYSYRSTMLYAPFAFDPQLWQRYQEMAGGAAAGAVAAVGAVDSSAQDHGNELLQRILDRLDTLELSLSIDGDIVAKKTLDPTDRGLGARSRNARRGSLID